MKDIAYIDRDCDCCGSDNLQPVWQYEKISKTRNEQFFWQVNNVVCKQCGFAFVSPVPTQQSLADYYGDSFSMYPVQDIDYSIENRLAIIRDCQAVSSAQSFLEIGSNNSSEFKQRVSALFARSETVEINDDCQSTYNDLQGVAAQSQDIVASYFVLEHIPDPANFLQQCAALLSKDGFLIIEVPNLYLYPKDPAGLMLYEHVNHFSPTSLMALAAKCGLTPANISLLKCSRRFGFVAVFQTSVNLPPERISLSPFEAQQACAYMTEGREMVEDFHRRIKAAKVLICSAQKKHVIVWCANEICRQLLQGETDLGHITVVDSDEKKSAYLAPTPVRLPKDVLPELNEAEIIVINSQCHAPAIKRWISENVGKSSASKQFVVLDYLPQG